MERVNERKLCPHCGLFIPSGGMAHRVKIERNVRYVCVRCAEEFPHLLKLEIAKLKKENPDD